MVRWPWRRCWLSCQHARNQRRPGASEETLNSRHSLLHSVRVQGGGARRAGARALPPRRRCRRAPRVRAGGRRGAPQRRPRRAGRRGHRHPCPAPRAASPGRVHELCVDALAQLGESDPGAHGPRPRPARGHQRSVRPARAARPATRERRSRGSLPAAPGLARRPLRDRPPARTPRRRRPGARPRPTDGHRRVRRVGTPMADGRLRRAGRPSRPDRRAPGAQALSCGVSTSRPGRRTCCLVEASQRLLEGRYDDAVRLVDERGTPTRREKPASSTSSSPRRWRCRRAEDSPS